MYRKALFVLAALLVFVVSSNAQDDPAEKVVGKWTKSIQGRTITFLMTADFKYEVDFTDDTGADVLGTYKLAESKIIFADEGGDYGADTSGEYEFELGEKSITFTEVNDPVNGRRMLVEGEWTRTEAP